MCSLRLLAILFCASIAYCTYNGDHVGWKRHPYLVKILTRDMDTKNITTCSGTLISPSTVLTSAKCFPGKTDRLQSQAIIPIQESTKTFNRAMLDVLIQQDTAIMRIDPISEKNFCNKPFHPSAVSRLNMKPSLTEATFKSVDVKDLTSYRCRIVGFKTNENVENFSTNEDVEIVDVEVRDTSNTLMFSEVFSNSTGSACWDDLGAPLECALDEDTFYTQVGFVHSIYTSGLTNEMEIANTTCADVKSTEYVVFGDLSIAIAIENADISGVFGAQHRCFHKTL